MVKRKKIDPELDALMPILIGYWRRWFKLSGPQDALQTREFRGFVAHVKELLENEDGSYETLLKKKELLGAYLLYFFPLRYQEALSLIGEIPFIGTKMLDLSIAPSPYPLAALKYGYIEATAISSSEEGLKISAEAAGRLGHPLKVRQANIRDLKLKEQYDLITISYTLFELFPDSEKRKEFLLSLINALTKEGYLLIVENSIEKINRRFLEMRDLINESGFNIQAPCIYQGKCPALAHKNMCFAQRPVEKPYLIEEANRSGKINMNSLKMSYLIVKKRESASPVYSKELYRVISPPFEENGRKSFYLCGVRGRMKITSTLKEETQGTKAFDYLKRGIALDIEKAKREGSTFILDEESQISVAAPLSKPLIPS